MGTWKLVVCPFSLSIAGVLFADLSGIAIFGPDVREWFVWQNQLVTAFALLWGRPDSSLDSIRQCDHAADWFRRSNSRRDDRPRSAARKPILFIRFPNSTVQRHEHQIHTLPN